MEIEYTIRKMEEADCPLLEDFLYEAIFVPEGLAPPPRSIVNTPALQVYIQNFGTRAYDMGLVAEAGGKAVGAVWARVMNDYGHIDDETPSLAISLHKEYRGQGIGTALMREMLAALKSRGCKRTSLAVQKANYAVRLYLRTGFEIVEEKSEEYIMVNRLQAEEPA